MSQEKLTTKKLEAKAESETESIERIVDVVQAGKVKDKGMQGIRVTLVAVAESREFLEARIRVRPLPDTGVRRTILNLKDWWKVGDGAKIKLTALNFCP